ncbi:MAG: polyprenyl synthetase family protein [Bacteroidetes bacterium]|nr:polyprenyl synthetase family protein [Bacteroidota bacterium]
MSSALNTIKKPIAKELALFEEKFKASLKSDVALLDTIMSYVVKRKGKEMRPILVFLSAKIFGDINDATYRGASLVELLHTATLVHDDVVDDSLERRGFFSINALWKNKIAVLIGDYLLSKGLLLSMDNDEFFLLKILSDAVRRMSEGELLQIERTRKLNITEADYYTIIGNKTASLIASCCAIGAATVTEDKAQVATLKQFGEIIGIAFQMKDDLFDFGTEDIGKPTGIDIKEKKMTLPLIYSLNNCTTAERRRIINIVKSKTKDRKKIDEVIRFVHEKGGIRFTIEKMHEYRDKAIGILQTLPQNEANTSLQGLVNYVVERKK